MTKWIIMNPACLCCRVRPSGGNSLIAGGVQL